MTNKICTVCRATKPLDKFVKHKVYRDGRGTMCKECANEIRRNHRQDNKKPTKAEKEMARQLLEMLGYNLNSDIPVHQQFLIRHNLVK